MSQTHINLGPVCCAVALTVAMLAVPVAAQTWALAQSLTVPGQTAFRATALADNGDVGGFVVVPNGTTTKLASSSGGSGNSPFDNTWLGALFNAPKFVKVPMGDVVPVVWHAGTAVMHKRYLNNTSTWLLGSAGPGKWITATAGTTGRVETSRAMAVSLPEFEWPSMSMARSWLEGSTFSASLGSPAASGDLVRVNASGAVLTRLAGKTSLVVGSTRTTVQAPTGYAGAAGVALGEDGTVLVNAKGPQGGKVCLHWLNGASTPIAVQTALTNPQVSCLGISRDGVVVGMVDEDLGGANVPYGERRRIYFTWQAGQTLSQSAPTAALSDWGVCVGVAQGGRSAAVGGLYPSQVFTQGKLLTLSEATSPSLPVDSGAVLVAMNDAGQILVRTWSQAGDQFATYAPR